MRNPCRHRTAHQLYRLARVQQRRQLQACRDILGGSDTPGRRWLIRQLRGDGAPYGTESIGTSLSMHGLERIRDQLRVEFPGVICGGDRIRHEPASEVFCTEVIT